MLEFKPEVDPVMIGEFSVIFIRSINKANHTAKDEELGVFRYFINPTGDPKAFNPLVI